jgi:superoxide dismutase
MGARLLGTGCPPHHDPTGPRSSGRTYGQGTIPLLAIDAREHAYYLQYQNEKAKFFDAIWNVINRDDVSRRLDDAKSGVLPAS